MAQTFTVQDFFHRFPDDDACLAYLMRLRYGETLDCPKCGKTGRFARLRKELAYACPWCGHHIHPMKGTPFERSHTPLQKWFYAIYLFCASRHGVPAKELQRQLGVTYKTAWRMGHEIRNYMAKVDGDNELSGHVEADETYIGGHRKETGHSGKGRGTRGKTIALGMVERQGKIMMRVVVDASTRSLIPPIVENVVPGATISTDEWRPYRVLRRIGFRHLPVNPCGRPMGARRGAYQHH